MARPSSNSFGPASFLSCVTALPQLGSMGRQTAFLRVYFLQLRSWVLRNTAVFSYVGMDIRHVCFTMDHLNSLSCFVGELSNWCSRYLRRTVKEEKLKL